MARPSAKQAASQQTVGHSPNYNFGTGFLDFTLDDFLPMPNGLALAHEMRKMWLYDETASAMRWCINSTLAQVKWKHLPMNNGQLAQDNADALKYAALADTMLTDMFGGFDAHVEDATAMIWAGFAPCEIVTKQRDGVVSVFNDKFYGIDKVPLRDPRTIMGWNYDNQENLLSMRQMAVEGSAVIPLWKVCHYRTTTELNNPEGIPLLLGAYRVWKLKKKIQDIEALGIERELVGLPVFRMPEAMYLQSLEVDGNGQPNDAAKRAQQIIRSATDAVSKMRLNKSGGIVLFSDTFNKDPDIENSDNTPMWDFKILTTGGSRTIDTRQPIRDYDRAISRVLMMQFLQLGDRSTGSYALSDDQSSMAYKSLMAIALKIANEWTQKALTLVWIVNGWPLQYLPLLNPGQINKQALQGLGIYMQGLGKVAGLWEGDPRARNSIMDTLDMDYTPDIQNQAADTANTAAETAATAPPPTFGAAPANPADPADQTNDSGD